MVLWCDGGEGGVSGVAGGGLHELTQVGSGSWVRRIGMQWPFDETRTAYATGGDMAALLCFIGVLGLGLVEGGINSELFASLVSGGVQRLRTGIQSLRGNTRGLQQEETQLLI